MWEAVPLARSPWLLGALAWGWAVFFALWWWAWYRRRPWAAWGFPALFAAYLAFQWLDAWLLSVSPLVWVGWLPRLIRHFSALGLAVFLAWRAHRTGQGPPPRNSPDADLHPTAEQSNEHV